MLRSVVPGCEGVNGLHEKDIQHRLHISCTQAREERGERREEGQYTKCKMKCIHRRLHISCTQAREERGERRVSTKKVK